MTIFELPLGFKQIQAYRREHHLHLHLSHAKVAGSGEMKMSLQRAKGLYYLEATADNRSVGLTLFARQRVAAGGFVADTVFHAVLAK